MPFMVYSKVGGQKSKTECLPPYFNCPAPMSKAMCKGAIDKTAFGAACERWLFLDTRRATAYCFCLVNGAAERAHSTRSGPTPPRAWAARRRPSSWRDRPRVGGEPMKPRRRHGAAAEPLSPDQRSFYCV